MASFVSQSESVSGNATLFLLVKTKLKNLQKHDISMQPLCHFSVAIARASADRKKPCVVIMFSGELPRE